MRLSFLFAKQVGGTNLCTQNRRLHQSCQWGWYGRRGRCGNSHHRRPSKNLPNTLHMTMGSPVVRDVLCLGRYSQEHKLQKSRTDNNQACQRLGFTNTIVT